MASRLRRPGLAGGASYLRMPPEARSPPPRGSDDNVRLFASVAYLRTTLHSRLVTDAYLRTTHQSTARETTYGFSHRSFDPPLGEFDAFWGPRRFFHLGGFRRLHHV